MAEKSANIDSYFWMMFCTTLMASIVPYNFKIVNLTH